MGGGNVLIFNKGKKYNCKLNAFETVNTKTNHHHITVSQNIAANKTTNPLGRPINS